MEKALQAGLIITDNILATKALEFAFLCKEEKFKGSIGWIENFKKLRKEAQKQRFISARQVNLDKFINVIE